ncbi:helix-turn-helix transcriptional regulator [Bradyrhizobium jicamae]|uniref:Helix-turn-helix transcriptional regulator n=1 Tax=Bradyrhizobium jicamae TaxID=280332 RepID=A0ABS5FT33_9BRAD|nr:helix-turn-helix transcriptional regulator [Bradyrhizobium jicamae]MBR0799932.1 helix-turn-helix transcriptional regulator [Bradyrhizobium jicamae]
MSDLERFSKLVGGIYDASLDPALWPDVFMEACKFIGASAATLASHHMVARGTTVFYNWGITPGYEKIYLERCGKINPFFPTAIFFDLETVHAPVPECVPRNEFCHSRFAKEWVAPQGFVDTLMSNLEKSAISCAGFWVFRRFNEGFADDEMRRRFALLVPHVRRALAIGQVINLAKIEAAALADSLDTLPAGMFLVDASGRIVHANKSGHVMVAEADVLRATGGRLAAIDLTANQALLDSFASAADGDAAVGRKGLAVPLKTREGERYVANVLPLTSGARRNAGIFYRAAATVFVHRAAFDLPSPPEAIVNEFKLTPRELGVLFAIVEVGGIPEVAEVLGISAETVKTHLGRLFEKTRTSRQADLVKLVAAFSNPLLR